MSKVKLTTFLKFLTNVFIINLFVTAVSNQSFIIAIIKLLIIIVLCNLILARNSTIAVYLFSCAIVFS